ncbi:NAD(P)H-dependent oxidoreductase [Streptomyces sp. NK08204]|uniref:NAD(P)H-dependent oxidoreductase n=1 Tax=Streptomyces sp. NK08204 TaxID=2873260 RepID=UPI001CED8263|nr:NADPH-dependent FMN reductase [Streptomyces sp. NK08204]
MRILAISGSLRQDSFNTQLLRALPPLAPEGMEIEFFDGLGDVPLYNQDLDVEDCPKPVQRLRTAIAEADGLIIASPEYNGSIPGVLKNAIDWASRPTSRSALLGKCVVTMVATPGRGLGRNALSDLGRVLHDCHAFVISGPWVHLSEAPTRMEAAQAEGDGEAATVLTDPMTRRLVDIQLSSLQDAVKNDAGRHAVVPLMSFITPRR